MEASVVDCNENQVSCKNQNQPESEPEPEPAPTKVTESFLEQLKSVDLPDHIKSVLLSEESNPESDYISSNSEQYQFLLHPHHIPKPHKTNKIKLSDVKSPDSSSSVSFRLPVKGCPSSKPLREVDFSSNTLLQISRSGQVISIANMRDPSEGLHVTADTFFGPQLVLHKIKREGQEQVVKTRFVSGCYLPSNLLPAIVNSEIRRFKAIVSASREGQDQNPDLGRKSLGSVSVPERTVQHI